MPDSQNLSFKGEMELDGSADIAAALEDAAKAEAETLRYTPPRHLKRIGIGAAVLAFAVISAGLASRMLAATAVDDWTAAAAVPVVKTIVPAAAKSASSLVLPGTIQAFNAAPIYAQVSGTVQKWFVDIGTPVKAGQILAQIDARSYQAALNQARGTLARDSANLTNARQDLARYQSLAAQNAISSQQLETQRATVNAGSGLVAADQASEDAAAINLGYTRIIAPFDGVVTSRSVDTGSFVAAGNGSQTPLFTVADQTRMRLYVRVPQNYAAAITPGMTARFAVPEYPGRVFTAAVAANSGAVDSASGAVLVQLQADNKDGALKPGAYAEVRFAVHAQTRAIQLPASVLIFRDGGPAVAVVGPGNAVEFHPVTLARDNGATIDIASGIRPSDRVIDNPPDSLSRGEKVRLAAKG